MAMLDLGPATSAVISLLDGVTDESLTAPTPCDGTSVAGMLDHLMGLSLAFTWGARKAPEGSSSGPPRASAESLPPDWRAVLPRRLDELAEAWRDPAAWQGTTSVAGVSMPGDQMGVVALDEVVMHGWDLARATGQPFSCDPASAEAVLQFTAITAQPENAAMRDGLFGPVVAVPDDASAFDKALGLAGRDPDWTPPPS
ncbi:MAG: hypothetical protein QOD35_1976 [Nocardioidaceae bacterium]|nr:hypothetical protein [Nocardioidaceae bacterium]